MKFHMDIWRAVVSLEERDIDTWKTTIVTGTINALKTAIFNEEVKQIMLRKRTYGNIKSKLYNVVLGQCSEALKAKLDWQDDWDSINKDHVLVKLMKSIKARMLNQQEDRNATLSTYSTISTLFRLCQRQHENLADYRKRFVATRDVLEHFDVFLGGGIVKLAYNILLEDFNKTREGASDSDANIADVRAWDRLLTITFINWAEEAR